MTEERRLVTVLFADVTGSTAMGEALDPEDLRALLARFYGIAREVIAGHGGTLEKFIGDAVMAVFGLPTAHGDDASRALAAGLALRDRVSHDPRLGERLPIRVGINTGEVVATRDAEAGGDFLVTGDAVNVAARLVQSADPWAVVAGERTVNAATDFEFDDTESIEAKGKALPVRAATVIGRASGRRRSVPLLGREADLAQLDLLADRAFGERRPYLVSIIAPAGTGKTRLLEEFLGHVGRRYGDATIAIAQCLPYGQRLTYWPLRAILFTLAGATEDTPAEGLRDQLVRRLSEMDVPEADKVAGQLLASIGTADEEVVDKTDLLAAWRLTLEHAAAQRPLVVVFEDLHWSSDSFLDLVEYVTQQRGEARLLMLVLTRPELLERRPSWGGGRRNHVSLALEPLDDGSISQLVGYLLESPTNELVQAVADRADGNPFYAGELVRALVDRVGPAPTHTDVAAALASLPDTVQATVLARLDALPSIERHCLQLGSVFGRSFRPAGLAALDASIGDRADQALDALLDRDMLRSAGADGYAFRHILIREVAYSTLTRAERARLHALAGEWLEQRATGKEEAYAELIAYHYREAATLASAVDGDGVELQFRAVEWLRRAAEVAMAARADVEARAHLLKALEWAPAELQPDVQERIGDTFVGGDATVAAYKSAYRLAKAAGRPADDLLRMLGKWLEYETRFVGSIAKPTGREEMNSMVAEGRRLLEVASDPVARARFFIGLAFLDAWWRGDLERQTQEGATAAREYAETGLRLATDANEYALMSSALDALAAIDMEGGAWRKTLRHAERRMELADRLPLIERVDAQAMIAWNTSALGDLERTVQTAQSALGSLQPGQVPSMALHLVHWQVVALHWLGRWDEAIVGAQRAKRAWEDLGRPAASYAVGCFLSAVAIARARHDTESFGTWADVIETILGGRVEPSRIESLSLALAREEFDLALEQFPLIQVSVLPTYVAHALGQFSDRNLLVPEHTLQAWADRAFTEGTPLVEAEARRGLALLHGEEAQAVRAIELFEQCSAKASTARVRCELGLLTGDENIFRAGAAILESLGDLDQLERFAARRP